MNASLLGGALFFGTICGLGLWLTYRGVFSRPKLIDRVAPLLVDISPQAQNYIYTKKLIGPKIFLIFFDPMIKFLKKVIFLFLGSDNASVYLRQSGSKLTLEDYRRQQAVWALSGLLLGFLLSLIFIFYTGSTLFTSFILPIIFASLFIQIRTLILRTNAKNRIKQIASEYPSVLELMSLSLSAGEGIFDAILRLANTGKGELCREFANLVVQVHSGKNFSTALKNMAHDLNWTPFSRTSEHILTASKRGVPLLGVLQIQAKDARELAKRTILEQAGKKEIAMMLPLVALVLPVTILFAVWPSFIVISSSF